MNHGVPKILLLMLSVTLHLAPVGAQDLETTGNPKNRPAPGVLGSESIHEFQALTPARRELVGSALEAGSRFRFDRYIYGSADPDRKGFDCSGSMYFILKKLGLKPARSSAAQFEWLRSHDTLTLVPPEATSLEHAVFNSLQPGDLLFWAGTYSPKDKRPNRITHVQMFLGTEKRTGSPVMIGSSDGRSYQGSARCGFGVFDFKLPRPGSKARFMGFGPPPGLEKIAD